MTTQAVRRIFIFGIFGILVGLSKGLPKDGPSKVLLLLISFSCSKYKLSTVVPGFSALCPSPWKGALNPGSALNPGKFIT